MRVRTEVRDTFDCSVERAFKASILGNATKYLKGNLFQPKVIAFEEDESWGKRNGIRYPVTAGNFLASAGRLCKEEILSRVENKYWRWAIYDFSPRALFFTSKMLGEWYVRENEKGKIDVVYIYTSYSINRFTHPLNWIFVQIQMRGFMKKAMQRIKEQAESDSSFFYERR